jgi:hypothetical protein
MTRTPPSIHPGDKVLVKGWAPASLEVVSIDHPSIVTLRSEYGVTMKVGRQAVIPAEGKTSTSIE